MFIIYLDLYVWRYKYCPPCMLACLPLTISGISTIISTNFHMGWDIRDGIFVPSTFILLHINTIGYLINIVRYTKSMAGILYVFKGCDILHRQTLNSTMSLGIIFQHIFFTTCTCMKYSSYVRKHFVLWYEQFFS